MASKFRSQVRPQPIGCLALALVLTGVLFAPAAARAAKPGSTLASFDTPGTYTWTVPHGVKEASFDVFGAEGFGGFGPLGIGVGGLGGEAIATFTVRSGEVYEIVVGGAGDNLEGGFNGGGRGRFQSLTNQGGGGGGGTDVRAGACAASISCGLEARILVGGGGGGGGSAFEAVPGGSGGGTVGGDSGAATGGTQTAGGTGDPPAGDGSFGFGGFGSTAIATGSRAGGGGGGGWFGGGGGTSDGGGGGSGFISGTAISGTMQNGVQSGDGMVMITKA